MQDDLFIRQRRVYTVSELTREVRGSLESAYPSVWIEGEISNFRQPMGAHMYFTLKDAGAQIKAVLFRGAQRGLTFTPADGMEVIARGRISVYEPRGEYQIVCDSIEPKGRGALQAAFEELRARLAAEGLFAVERKKPIPPFPVTIGLVTSPGGAAVQDFLRTAVRRFFGVHVLIYPVRVQGDSAAAEVAGALEWFNRHVAADVIAVVRGGGSLEDLWPFNEEILVRAIAISTIPVVTGVGHETDFTLADFAADQRALTPTDAARIAVPDAAELRERALGLAEDLRVTLAREVGDRRLKLERLNNRLDRSRDIVNEARQQIEEQVQAMSNMLSIRIRRGRDQINHALRRAAENHPRQRVTFMRARSADFSHRLGVTLANDLHEKRRKLIDAARLLRGLSPFAVLDRGYSLVFDRHGALVRAAVDIQSGDAVSIKFAGGSAEAEIISATNDNPRDTK